MGYGYYDYYTTPIMSFVNYGLVLGITAIVAVIAGIVLCCTFLKKRNEGRYAGVKGKIYNAMTFNRFYAENIIKFVYIIAACVITAMGIVLIVMGSFILGIILLVGANLVLRLSFEMVLMFIILCKKSVSMDRRLSKIENFYVENYGDDWGSDEGGCCEPEEEEQCGGDCGSCGVSEELENFHLNIEEEAEE